MGILGYAREERMRTFVGTDKKLSVIAVIEEIDFRDNSCEVAYFNSFVAWAQGRALIQTSIHIDIELVFWKEWLHNIPEAQEWLVQHGFAKWKTKFEPFFIKIDTIEEAQDLWHKINMNERTFENSGYHPTEFDISYSKSGSTLSRIWHQIDNRLRNK